MAKLHFYYAAMNAGKTTTLLQSSYNYREKGMKTLLFTPSVDNRYGYGMISSRIGLQEEALIFFENTDIFAEIEQKYVHDRVSCVLLDEAQFLNKTQVHQLCRVTDKLGIPVLAYGLRTDFLGEPFLGSMYLMAWADIIIELKTICHCGRKATMNMRIDENGQPVRAGEQVEIGGNDRYLSVCRHHYWQGVPFGQQAGSIKDLDPVGQK